MIFLSSDEFSFSFIRDHPLPVIDTLLPFSSENENKVVNTGILASEEKSHPYSSHRGFKASKLSHHKSPMLSVRESWRRTKNDRVDYELDAKQALSGNLKSSCTGYSLKDKNEAKNDKTKHENGENVKAEKSKSKPKPKAKKYSMGPLIPI
ncbi:hypothetical protein Tco_0763054 [Tanacetum coccineum]